MARSNLAERRESEWVSLRVSPIRPTHRGEDHHGWDLTSNCDTTEAERRLRDFVNAIRVGGRGTVDAERVLAVVEAVLREREDARMEREREWITVPEAQEMTGRSRALR